MIVPLSPVMRPNVGTSHRAGFGTEYAFVLADQATSDLAILSEDERTLTVFGHDAAAAGQTIRACSSRESEAQDGPKRPVVFLDRDGTIIVDKTYNANPDDIDVFDDVVPSLRRLLDAGYGLVVVTNQAGVARGFFGEAAIQLMHDRLNCYLNQADVTIHAYYYCPHHVEGVVPEFTNGCTCRKPAPGMILRAARDFAIDLDRSWLVGDTQTDVEAAVAAGVKSLRIDRCADPPLGVNVSTLGRAVDEIIARDGLAESLVFAARRAARRR
jgi:D-glycero-D-manno-heptose 1,7-bisphosphate phosphatase